MKKLEKKQKKYIITMFSLIVICELLLRIENKLFQFVGIILLPIIITCGVLLIRCDQKTNIN